MTDFLDVLPIIHTKLQNDDTIAALVDSGENIYRGSPTLQDAKLETANHTCICVPNFLNINSADFVGGGASHKYDGLFEVDIISRGRTYGDNEAYSGLVMMTVLKFLQTPANTGLNLMISNIGPQFEPEISWHRWMIKGRAIGTYSSA
jgi:hypothetical protein